MFSLYNAFIILYNLQKTRNLSHRKSHCHENIVHVSKISRENLLGKSKLRKNIRQHQSTARRFMRPLLASWCQSPTDSRCRRRTFAIAAMLCRWRCYRHVFTISDTIGLSWLFFPNRMDHIPICFSISSTFVQFLAHCGVVLTKDYNSHSELESI